MQPSVLPIAVMNVEAELDAAFPAFLDLPPDVDQHLSVCMLYRQLAVGSLLLTAEPSLFFAYLFRSARTFLHALDSAPPARFPASRFSPFLDAVACRDEEGAGRIASAAPGSPMIEAEYEEDFLYFRILMDLYLDRPKSGIETRLERFSELVQGNPDPRFPVCNALFGSDAGDFEPALEAAIEWRREEIRADIEEDIMDPDDAALSAVSVDVLAWLELAHRAGIPLRESYPLAPSIARAFHRRALPDPSSWRLGSLGV